MMRSTATEQTAPEYPRPHDLLWLADASALVPLSPLPYWASADWIAAAPVVVRRQKLADAALLPVGLRGRERSERLAACVPLAAVARCVSPEMLARQSTDIASNGIAALEALTMSRALLDDIGLPWGPTGGVGFMLATGLPVLHAQSDLDLVLRAPSPLDRRQTSLLSKLMRSAACRIDLQIDTGFGGFSFTEWLAGRDRILLKTDTGPLLTRDPWQVEVQAI